ncbi:MAG: hypothetical protein R3C25_14470 [Hyphomonadaceae bacterium]
MRLSLFAGAIMLALYCSAHAQDWSRAPIYERPNDLSAGFLPDPHVMSALAGGDIDAATSIGGACAGFLSASPGATFTYQAGERFPLIIRFDAEAGATYVVRAGDGAWYCGVAANGLRFSTPASGGYDVWIGLRERGAQQRVQISLSERD